MKVLIPRPHLSHLTAPLLGPDSNWNASDKGTVEPRDRDRMPRVPSCSLRLSPLHLHLRFGSLRNDEGNGRRTAPRREV